MRTEIAIVRKYSSELTMGTVFIHDVEVCKTIELPWEENLRNISCIPEGDYLLGLRHTERLGDHLVIEDVPGRQGILIHPANDAKKELRGCIAPVMAIENRIGKYSGIAMELLMRNVRRFGVRLCHIKISSI